MGPNLILDIKPVEDGENHQVVSFNGELDKAGHMEVKPQLDELVENFENKTLVFDFTGLKFINSEGIGYLMEIHTHLLNRGKELVIVAVGAHIADVFEAIGINEIITLYPDLNSFISR